MPVWATVRLTNAPRVANITPRGRYGPVCTAGKRQRNTSVPSFVVRGPTGPGGGTWHGELRPTDGPAGDRNRLRSTRPSQGLGNTRTGHTPFRDRRAGF